MAKRQLRIRNKSGSMISELVGNGQVLLETDLPTRRDLLRYMVYLKEQNECISIAELVNIVYSKLILLWSKANTLFSPPVIFLERSIKRKLKSLWDEASKCTNPTVKKNMLQKFIANIDKLFDITSCNCLISSCDDVQCQGCKVNAHISCICPQGSKIPLKELVYIKGQRAKIGSKGPHQMACSDNAESKRLEKKRFQKEER